MNDTNKRYTEEEWEAIREAKINEQDLVYRLEKRAEIRRQAKGRKSVEEGKPDRLSDLLEEAANEIKRLRKFDQ